MKTQILICLLGPFAAAFSCEIDYDKPTAKLKRFVEDVTYVVESGDKESYSKRWLFAPKVSVSSSDPVLKTYAETSVAAICKDAKLETPGTLPLTVYIGPSKDLLAIAAARDRKIELQSGHGYWIWWNDDRSIRDAVVFLCTDKLSGNKAQDALLTDLLGAFGLVSKSREFDETALSAKDGIFTSPSALDRKTVSFIYSHVPPGTSKPEFRKLFETRWGK